MQSPTYAAVSTNKIRVRSSQKWHQQKIRVCAVTQCINMQSLKAVVRYQLNTVSNFNTFSNNMDWRRSQSLRVYDNGLVKHLNNACTQRICQTSTFYTAGRNFWNVSWQEDAEGICQSWTGRGRRRMAGRLAGRSYGAWLWYHMMVITPDSIFISNANAYIYTKYMAVGFHLPLSLFGFLSNHILFIIYLQ